MTTTFVSYAQNYEDVYLWRALKHVERGCYIDVGAYDPTTDSVTRAFYERGWRGINLEPTQACFNRLCEARPEDMNLNMAAGSAEGSMTLYEVPGTGMSTPVYENALRAQQSGFSSNAVQVEVTTLNKIWEDSSLCEVHFLKIDVEGGEELVLRGLNLSRHRPWIIVVESTIPNSTQENFASWESILVDGNYSFAMFDGLNRYYVAKERSNLADTLSTPANIFDYFVRSSELEACQETERLRQTLQGARQETESVRQETERLRQTLQRARQETELLRGALDTLYQSRSWRYTAPLRVAKIYFARIVQKSRHAGGLSKYPQGAVQGLGRWALSRSALRRLAKILLPWPMLRWRIRRLLLATEGDKAVSAHCKLAVSPVLSEGQPQRRTFYDVLRD